jgi:carboxyl-terminal processing protease
MLLIDALFKNFSIFDVDQETAMLAAIRAYVQATGDKYALFYTPEELEATEAENNGDLYGIGVQVIFDYDEYFMEVVLIMPDSPAEKCRINVSSTVSRETFFGLFHVKHFLRENL